MKPDSVEFPEFIPMRIKPCPLTPPLPSLNEFITYPTPNPFKTIRNAIQRSEEISDQPKVIDDQNRNHLKLNTLSSHDDTEELSSLIHIDKERFLSFKQNIDDAPVSNLPQLKQNLKDNSEISGKLPPKQQEKCDKDKPSIGPSLTNFFRTFSAPGILENNDISNSIDVMKNSEEINTVVSPILQRSNKDPNQPQNIIQPIQSIKKDQSPVLNSQKTDVNLQKNIDSKQVKPESITSFEIQSSKHAESLPSKYNSHPPSNNLLNPPPMTYHHPAAKINLLLVPLNFDDTKKSDIQPIAQTTSQTKEIPNVPLKSSTPPQKLVVPIPKVVEPIMLSKPIQNQLRIPSKELLSPSPTPIRKNIDPPISETNQENFDDSLDSSNENQIVLPQNSDSIKPMMKGAISIPKTEQKVQINISESIPILIHDERSRSKKKFEISDHKGHFIRQPIYCSSGKRNNEGEKHSHRVIKEKGLENNVSLRGFVVEDVFTQSCKKALSRNHESNAFSFTPRLSDETSPPMNSNQGFSFAGKGMMSSAENIGQSKISLPFNPGSSDEGFISPSETLIVRNKEKERDRKRDTARFQTEFDGHLRKINSGDKIDISPLPYLPIVKDVELIPDQQYPNSKENLKPENLRSPEVANSSEPSSFDANLMTSKTPALTPTLLPSKSVLDDLQKFSSRSLPEAFPDKSSTIIPLLLSKPEQETKGDRNINIPTPANEVDEDQKAKPVMPLMKKRSTIESDQLGSLEELGGLSMEQCQELMKLLSDELSERKERVEQLVREKQELNEELSDLRQKRPNSSVINLNYRASVASKLFGNHNRLGQIPSHHKVDVIAEGSYSNHSLLQSQVEDLNERAKELSSNLLQLTSKISPNMNPTTTSPKNTSNKPSEEEMVQQFLIALDHYCLSILISSNIQERGTKEVKSACSRTCSILSLKNIMKLEFCKKFSFSLNHYLFSKS